MADSHRDLKSHHPTQSMEAHMVLLQIHVQNNKWNTLWPDQNVEKIFQQISQ